MGTLWERLLICSLLIWAGIPIVSAIPIFPGNFTAHFIDVGEGDAIFLITPTNNTILIDSGRNATMGTKVSQYIQESGLNIDLIIATHSDADHIRGMESVLSIFTPQSFIDSPYPAWTATYQNMRNTINQSEIPYMTVQAGSSVPSYQGLNISILNPQAMAFGDTNDNSIVLMLQYGSVGFLFTGDAEQAAENQMINNGSELHAQILKVSEHGSSSASSPNFLERVDPEVAVIEVGAGNQYHHPTNETLENLAAAGARIYRTDLNGTVVITTDGAAYTVYTESGSPQIITATAGPGGTIVPNGLVEVNYGATPIFNITPNSIGTGSPSVPVTPQVFYGFVDAMDQPVQTGIPVEVRGIGVMSGVSGNPFIINETGKYGSQGISDPKLFIQGNILDGTLLTFYVNGHPAKVSAEGEPWQDTYPFKSGTVTSLNLSVSELVDNAIPIPSYYVIKDVIVDGISKGPVTSYQFDPVTTDHTILAIFDPIYLNFTIWADSGEGGVISPNGTVNVAAGADQTFTITPNAGMKILDVKVDNATIGPVASYIFTNISQNHTIHATFDQLIQSLTIDGTSGEGGNISPNGIMTVFSGENLTYTITPDADFVILDVKVDNASIGPVSSYIFTNVTTSHTIDATFALAEFTIIATVGPEGKGTITPSGTVGVIAGTDQTFTITPDPGHLDCWGSGTRFVIWNITVDGEVITGPGEPSLIPINYTITNVSADHTISANFTEMIIDARPLAKFSADPRSGIAPLNVQFSQVLVSNNTGLLWSFGDNSTSTVQNPNHTYSSPGNYNVSLTIYCDNQSFTEEEQNFIDVFPNLPPIGGNKGFFLVHANVNGASVYFDSDFKGNVTNGTLNVSVFTTATPYRTFTVKANGFNDFKANITQYPGKGNTVDLYANLIPSGFVNFNFHFVDFPSLKFVEFPSFYPFNFTFFS